MEEKQTPVEVNQEDVSYLEKKRVPLMLAGAVVVVTAVLAGAAGYYFGLANSQPITQAPQPPQTQVPEGVACTLEAKLCPDGSSVGRTGPNCEFEECPSENTEPQSFKTRLFDQEEFWFAEQKYPVDITNIQDNELLGLNCSERFIQGEIGGGGTYYSYSDQGSKAAQLTDQTILDQVKLIGSSSGYRVDEFITCQTSNNRTLVIFGENKGGGGTGNEVFLAEIKNGVYVGLGSLANPGAPYFNCSRPLMLTKGGVFYIRCGGGDGGFGASGIYAFDTTQKTVQEITYCTSAPEKVECR